MTLCGRLLSIIVFGRSVLAVDTHGSYKHANFVTPAAKMDTVFAFVKPGQLTGFFHDNSHVTQKTQKKLKKLVGWGTVALLLEHKLDDMDAAIAQLTKRSYILFGMGRKVMYGIAATAERWCFVRVELVGHKEVVSASEHMQFFTHSS
jgi:hypothetical protein